jgi:hypothetical protein
MANFNQRINDLAPDDATWQDATSRDKLDFFKEAGQRAKQLKKVELERGIGANGQRMKPRKRPRPDNANGPVLIPNNETSRTVRLMDAHADIQGITLYWRSGHSNVQRLPWGTILGFHARGEVPGAPVRDVRLSKRGINLLRKQMAQWWDTHHAGRIRQAIVDRQAAEEAARKKPKIAAKAKAAKAAMVKRYNKLADYFNPRGGGF